MVCILLIVLFFYSQYILFKKYILFLIWINLNEMLLIKNVIELSSRKNVITTSVYKYLYFKWLLKLKYLPQNLNNIYTRLRKKKLRENIKIGINTDKNMELTHKNFSDNTVPYTSLKYHYNLNSCIHNATVSICSFNIFYPFSSVIYICHLLNNLVNP